MDSKIAIIKNETLKTAQNINNIQKIRKIKLYSIIHEMIRKGIKKTKREIFYSSPNIFKRQDVVNKMIDNLLKSHNLKMIDFNICASLKGIFYGKLIFDDGKKEFTLMKDLIPDINEIKKIKCEYQNILVIEKDSMLTFIKEVYLKYQEAPNFLLVSGKGYPDKNTLHLLEFLEKEKKKIFVFFDLDPHGLNIFMNYKKTIKSMERIGVKSRDVHTYKICKNDLLSLTQRDLKLLDTLKKNTSYDKTLVEDISFLEGLGSKMEMEIFTSQNTHFIIDYLKENMM